MLVRDLRDGIMIPIPQYPLYSATLTLIGGHQIEYMLDEHKGWGFDRAELDRALHDAEEHGVNARALCVINPGNPTGQVLSERNMQEVLEFCREKNMVLLADEVYQENIYTKGKPFLSFKKVLHEMGADYNTTTQLVSFHSTSKGFMGECGMRGGYMELTNICETVTEQAYKLVSIGLCSNLPGQLMTSLMVNPPKLSDPSGPLFQQERDGIVESLGRRARKVAEAFNKMEGMTCNDAEGAMYLFPKLTLPPGAVTAAGIQGLAPDVYYSIELLMNTGICVVPGSGFGQEEGTFHFRTTFLPPENKMDHVIKLMADFHGKFMAAHK